MILRLIHFLIKELNLNYERDEDNCLSNIVFDTSPSMCVCVCADRVDSSSSSSSYSLPFSSQSTPKTGTGPHHCTEKIIHHSMYGGRGGEADACPAIRSGCRTVVHQHVERIRCNSSLFRLTVTTLTSMTVRFSCLQSRPRA